VRAAAAAPWFAVNAVSFVPAGGGIVANPGSPGGLDGDAAAVAVVWAARTLFVGLTLVALALVDWGRLAAIFKDDPTPKA
jgi:hypothetical protein